MSTLVWNGGKEMMVSLTACGSDNGKILKDSLPEGWS